MRKISGLLCLALFALGACGTSGGGTESPEPAGKEAAPESTAVAPPDTRLIIPGVSAEDVFTAFQNAGLECPKQVFDFPATEFTPQAVGRNCSRETKEGLSPLAGVTVAHPSHVDVIVLEMEDTDLDAIAKEDVLQFFQVITEVPFEGVDLRAVDEWLEAEVLAESPVDLAVGDLVFTLSGTEYRQMLTAKHSASCFRFTYASERPPTEEEREACTKIAKASD